MTQQQDTMALAIEAMVNGEIELALALTEQAEADGAAALLYIRYAALLARGEAEEARRVRDAAAMTHLLPAMAEQDVDLARMATDGPYALQTARKFYNGFQMAAAILALKCAMNDPRTAFDAVFIKAQAEHYQARNDEAMASFRMLLDARPSPSIHSFILYCLFFVDENVRRQAEEAARYNARWTPQYAMHRRPLTNSRRTDRRVRIGYMGPTFTGNHSSFFIQNLLELHDRERFEVFAYTLDAAKERPIEGVTVRGMGHLSYAATAELIRNDEIDVLIDFHGHAAWARPMVYACRAAPVQVSWLSWIMTTGLDQMDYVIHADHMDPPDPSLPFPEKVISVGPVLTAYRPHATARPSPCPALERGYVTFTSFNHPTKISDLIIGKWAQIFKRVPNAKLHLKYAGLDDIAVQMEITARFLAAGVHPSVLEFSGHSKGEAYEEAFAHVDLALDTQPYPGGTTTLDAVSRGVPVLTLNGPNFYGQIAVPAMICMGLEELIASDWEDYIDKAVAYANDLPRLAALRERVRPAFDASPYRDEVGFARRMEGVYLKVFAAWAEKGAADDVTVEEAVAA